MTILEVMERANSRDTKLVTGFIKDAIMKIQSSTDIVTKVEKQNLTKNTRDYYLPTDFIALSSISILDTNDDDKYKAIRRLSKRPNVTSGVVKEYGTTNVIYPDETITNGIRIEYTALVNPFVAEDPEGTAYSSLTAVSSPTELTHLNLNRMLSLAIVDYVKAAIAERDGNLEQKEYYMRQFSKKVSDNESNKNKMYITQSTSYAVK